MNKQETINTTPMMRQYEGIKRQYPDAILFFRMGDFYEMFNEDAKTASKILGITLTSRNKNKDNAVPLCGIPYHSVDSYINKLIKAGYKVAICEQIEDPRLAKGIVKRDVIRVVTPGTYLDTSSLGNKENSFLSSIFPHKDKFGFALLDLSTGEFRVQEFLDDEAWKKLIYEVNKTEPKEMLIPQTVYNNNNIQKFISYEPHAALTPYEDWVFEYDFAYRLLLEHFGVASLAGFGCENLVLATSAAGAVIHYIKETQKSPVAHINRVTVQSSNNCMNLDYSTMRHMELIKRAQDGKKDGSLFSLLDRTVTAMGGRRLKSWIVSPLIDIEKIDKRHEVVERLKDNSIIRRELRHLLSDVCDMERIIGKVTLQYSNARDMLSLKSSVAVLPKAEELLKEIDSKNIKSVLQEWDNLADIHSMLDRAIDEDPPLIIRDGGIIKDNFNAELDELRKITKEGRGWITELETRERERTGILSLKIRYNNVYGYYIEVTKKNLGNIPEDYIRKQSLVNAERFISQELKEYETKIFNAEEKIKELEFNLFEKIRKNIAGETKRIQKMAAVISEIDVFAAFADVASKYNYVKPKMNEEDILHIAEGRHPVVELLNPDERFIPNDTYLDCKDNQIAIVTGPNMAGKSTYLRQVALIVLMSQIGSFVPAAEAAIGVVDRIFTRVGAHDDLIKGQSTFMVEMSEAANILNSATRKSLIILDEIGRGTSTFDGISIAWAIAEYIHDKDKIGARTLFATHYFELTELARTHDSIKNYNISVKEWNNRIIFLRKIMEGSADKSYGIQVARLAGLPEAVMNRAREILADLENAEIKKRNEKKMLSDDYKQLDLFLDTGYDSIIQDIKKIDIENLTPIQALNILNDIKKRVD